MSTITSANETLSDVRSAPGTPTWEIARLFPNQGDWSEEAYLALDTNHLIEFTDGRLEFLPMPDLYHQVIVKWLFLQLHDFVETRRLGQAYFAPLRVRLGKGKYREPDVVFLRPERVKHARRPTEGADLVMEVVSEGTENRERDLVKKRADYARAGIAEYWIIDPERQRVTVLTLDGNDYRVHGEFGRGDTATSLLLPEFTVPVEEAFAAAEAVEDADDDATDN